MSLSLGERTVLKTLQPEMLKMMTMTEWVSIVRKADNAGSLSALDPYAMEVLTKAARRSFGGNRSAAGSYAANIRWGRSNGGGGGSSQIQSGSVAGGAKSGANYSDIDDATDKAMGTVAPGSKQATELETAKREVAEAKAADVGGKPLDAWERASQAEFRVGALASVRGASMELKRLANMLRQLVLDLTDAYFAERQAA